MVCSAKPQTKVHDVTGPVAAIPTDGGNGLSSAGMVSV